MKRGSPFYRRNDGPRLYDKTQRDNEEITLFSQTKKHFLEREVKSDDTLQSIALEFNVSVGELKRVNNIHKENEIYARRLIKVPAKPHSLLIETEEIDESNTAQKSAVSSKNSDILAGLDIGFRYSGLEPDDSSRTIGSYSLSVSAIRNNQNHSSVSSETSSHFSNDIANCYFKPIKNEQTIEEEVSESENSTLLPETQQITPASNVESKDVLSCNGADWGISWPLLIILALLLIVGIPVYYVWFLWENNEIHHS